MMRLPGTRPTVDVALSVGLIAGSGAVFLIESLIRIGSDGAGIIQLPLIVFLIEAAAAAAVLVGARWARFPVLIIVVLAAILHLQIALGSGLGWTRVISGLLFAVQMYALVVLNTKPVREHFGLRT
jgi:hypothetical protein